MAMTDEEKRAEIERVTKISGFRVKAHELLAEIDQQLGTSFLKARNDRWEKEHGTMTRQERMEEELQRAMCYVASPGKAPGHVAIHIHMAHQCGASKEYLLDRLMKAAQWGGNPEGSQTAIESWRIIFMPDFPSVFPTRIAELTSDSVPRE
jgi:hypothetical protein